MSASAPAITAEGSSKKRKRTGKEREERKAAAIEAQRNADALLAAARGEVAPTAVSVSGAAPAGMGVSVAEAGAGDMVDQGMVGAVAASNPEAEVRGEYEADGLGEVKKEGPDVEAIAKRIVRPLSPLSNTKGPVSPG